MILNKTLKKSPIQRAKSIIRKNNNVIILGKTLGKKTKETESAAVRQGQLGPLEDGVFTLSRVEASTHQRRGHFACPQKDLSERSPILFLPVLFFPHYLCKPLYFVVIYVFFSYCCICSIQIKIYKEYEHTHWNVTKALSSVELNHPTPLGAKCAGIAN